MSLESEAERRRKIERWEKRRDGPREHLPLATKGRITVKRLPKVMRLPGRHNDGRGLILEVRSDTSASWLSGMSAAVVKDGLVSAAGLRPRWRRPGDALRRSASNWRVASIRSVSAERIGRRRRRMPPRKTRSPSASPRNDIYGRIRTVGKIKSIATNGRAR